MERPSRVALEWLALGALLAVVSGAAALGLRDSRRSLEATERARLQHQASIVDRMLSTRLQATASALDLLRADQAEHRARPGGLAVLGEHMRAMVASTVGVRTFLLVDGRGVAVASNRAELLGQDFSGGERYRAMSRAPDPARLYVSAPFMTPLGKWALSLGRVVLDARGRFDGYLLAVLDPDYFHLLLDATRYAPDMAAGLIHGGGKVIYRVPDPQGAIGLDLSAVPGSSFGRHVASGRDLTTVTAPLAPGGAEALSMLRTVRPQGSGADGFLVAGFSRETSAIFAGWHREVRDRVVVLAILALAASFGLHLVQRRRRERLLQEAARQAMQARAAASQKLESIGRLAGGVAHDFNNLLTIILSSGGEARQEARQGRPPDLEVMDEIMTAAERAADLTRQLLAFARKQSIAPVTLDLNEQLRGSQKLLRRVIGEDVRIVERLEPEIWPVRCDPGLLAQVVLNLAVNARDAMPGGGTLTLSTRNVTVPPGGAVPGAGVEPGDYVLLQVADTGTGMTPEVAAHLFEPFFTTKVTGKGTGLGLSTVYGIVKQSGAHIGVHTAPGQGTTFEIHFPRRALAAPEPARAAPRVVGGSETILVVEDEAAVRAVVAHGLRVGGYRVLEAADAGQAVALAGAEPGGVALLVADVVMPGAHGPEVARLVAERCPGVPVLYMSGHPPDEENRHGFPPGPFDFLEKPFTMEALRAQVREMLDRPRGAPPA